MIKCSYFVQFSNTNHTSCDWYPKETYYKYLKKNNNIKCSKTFCILVTITMVAQNVMVKLYLHIAQFYLYTCFM